MPRVASILLIVLTGVAPDGLAQVSLEQQLEFLLSTMPPDVRDEVTLLVPEGEGFRTYQQGASAFECIADEPGDDHLSLLCYHKAIGRFLAHQGLMARRGLEGEAFWERVCGDVENGLVTVPNRAYVLSASAALPPDGGPPDSITVYHLLQLPYATEHSLGLTDEELVPGAPWIHHAGTCDAHVMWSEVRPFSPR